jgi:carboxypeptidase family protein
MRRSITVALLVILSARAAAAQVVRPPRDRPNGPPPSVGTGVISGRVVDAPSGSAVARARVRLNWMGPGVRRPPVTTDTSGNFAFTELPPGSFTLAAEKSTYLTARYPEAGPTLRAANQPVPLSDGQTVDRLVIRMYHGGAITGHVIDANGDPVEMVQIQALRLPKFGGRPQPRFGGGSNDLGEFRIPRLEPGQYVLLATPNRSFVPPDRADVGNTEPQPMPTFYPSVLSMGQAQPISVARGATVAGIDLQLVDGQAASVSGTVIDAAGQPIATGGMINVRPIVKDLSAIGFGMSSGTGVRPDGTFQVTLPPGEYELEANASQARVSGPTAPGMEQVGVVRVNVAGPVSGITITLGSAAKVSGRFVFDGSSPVPAIAALSGPGTIAFTSLDGSSCRGGRSETAPDWTFTVEGISGTCTARFYGSIGRWVVKAIMHDGNDLMDRPVTFTPGQHLRGAEVVMTDKISELIFHVTDERGLPTRDYVALVFTVDQSKWSDTGGRYLRTLIPPPEPTASSSATPGDAGANRIFVGGAVPGSSVTAMATNPSRRQVVAGLPAGEYFAIAVNDLDVDGFRDPPFLEQLSRRATRVTIADGGRAEVTLRRINVALSPP